MRTPQGILAVAGFGALALLAACNSSGGGTSGQPAGGGMTVSVQNVSGTGQVLVDAQGRTLYTSDQEQAAGKILCASSACQAIWTPLTVGMGQQPSGPSGVSGKLGTEKRPDGSLQVTFRGGPLYTFTFDHSAGQVNGNGQKDSFDGTNFVWRAATASGVAAQPTSGASTPGYGGGGYGY